MKRFFAILTMLLLCAAPTLADYLPLPLPELTAQSDIIARVRVLSTRRNPRPKKIVQSQLAYSPDMYEIAVVEVVESLYGTSAEKRIEIGFDSRIACPGVFYKKGEECIVFLSQYGNDYETSNWSTGKKQWRTLAEYQATRTEINRELVKLAAPTYTGLRGAKLRAWKTAQWQERWERYELYRRILNQYRDTADEKFLSPLNWLSPR
ncbi:MAG: hypothetical protein H7Y38_16920 [Armatimonadetes bacterium]|nr:hypothetical protein [Armatimonadota bacterium]